MFDTKQFISAMHQIAEEKGIPEEKIFETIEMAIAAAYKKDYAEKGQIIRVKLDSETGDAQAYRIQIVVQGVDEEGMVTGEISEREKNEAISMREKFPEEGENSDGEIKIKFNPEKHIILEDAIKKNKKIKIGDELITKLEHKTDFGRIAAQTAKQVILQRLREIEREAVLKEFKEKEGEVVSGTVQRIEGRVIYIDLGRTSGILPPSEQISTEHYRIGQRIRVLVLRVEETNRGPAIILSRAHPQLVISLFSFEVPEMESGSIEVRAIAREPGSRSKVAVLSNDDSVDPIGSLVGQKGVRVQTVINELGGEKIDIIEWSDDPALFIAKALSPAKILEVKILDKEAHHAVAEVAEDQFSLAIGKRGQNVRLAAKLTGWKLDVRSPESEISSDSIEEVEVAEIEGNKEEDVEVVEDKKEENKE